MAATTSEAERDRFIWDRRSVVSKAMRSGWRGSLFSDDGSSGVVVVVVVVDVVAVDD